MFLSFMIWLIRLVAGPFAARRFIDRMIHLETVRFGRTLAKQSPEEMAELLVEAIALRKEIETQFPYQLLDPVGTIRRFPKCIILLISEGQFWRSHPAGLNLWLHTLRSARTPACIPSGRILWRQIERAFDHLRLSKSPEQIALYHDELPQFREWKRI